MERPPALAAEKVREFVIAGHGNLERVQEMLAEQPGLLNAAWDWGGGDFETALAGAAHTGSREIARHLLAQGAHMTLSAAAMLGELDLVKAILAVQPEARHAPGAHGIPLKVHAQQGGDAAAAVVAYLDGLD
ncbi:MAG: ankyrin repeat domain-containing protein [Anaerolineae bacterium]|nr:ankyrin repeat domain-containing protein [Anaerolineae bacterium]